MGKKGGKKKHSQTDQSGGSPEQAQSSQSSSGAPSQAEPQANVSSQPGSSQSTPGGRSQAQGDLNRGTRVEAGHLLPPAFKSSGQTGQAARQEQPQQQQYVGGQQRQGQSVVRGRGTGRGFGRGQGLGPSPHDSPRPQQQNFPALGHSRPQTQQEEFPSLGARPKQPQHQQRPVSGKCPAQPPPAAAQQQGQQAQDSPQTQPAQPPPAVAQQQGRQAQDSPQTKVANVQKVTEQVGAVSLKEQGQATPKKLTMLPKKPIETLGIPKRKDPLKAGTQGRPIKVFTNMMAINFADNFKSTVIHYDVNIEPDKPKYLMRAVFKEAQKRLFPKRYPAFDGKKNCFSAGYLPIPNAPTEVTVFNEDGIEKNYKITFKVANELDLSWLKNVRPGLLETERNQISLQALDIILRHAPSLARNVTQVGRSFFTPTRDIKTLTGGMDCWYGLFQSAVLGWKPLLNFDIAHKGFPTPQTVLKAVAEICPQFNESQDQFERKREDIRNYLKGLKVVYEIPRTPTSRRTFRIHDLVGSAQDSQFEHNGQVISIKNYYHLHKKYIIQYPHLPCLWVGTRNKNIHVPMELCTVVGGQATQKKLDEKQTAVMIKHAATNTTDRRNKIMAAFAAMNHNDDPCMREFGISISGKFEEISARVLNPPKLVAQETLITVNKGIWTGNKFDRPSTAIAQDNSWIILNLDNWVKPDQLRNLHFSLQRTGNNLGMAIGNPVTPYSNHPNYRTNDIFKFFMEKKKFQPRLIVVIVPNRNNTYSTVKQISELNAGLLTQCLKGTTLSKLSPPTLTNILLKINAKLNGINHRMYPGTNQAKLLPPCLQEPCMIVGADVTHPSPDAQSIPSIAAVAASYDPSAFKYNIEIRLQPPRMEIIQDLIEITKKQLMFFYRQTQHKPRRIIFYRDGVSEGQFGQVMDTELRAIREACSSMPGGGYMPAITFLVVQKRHHTRFFPMDPRRCDDRNGNVSAGTVVDTQITHPSDIDFYLVSHASIQGTARPTKYRCLHDDNNMSEDEIEQLTYFLCHMFSRCNRSVSYPTPTYYAHLAAFRARALTQGIRIDLNNLQEEQHRKLRLNEEFSKNSPMFFV